jgi:hypothetical protein
MAQSTPLAVGTTATTSTAVTVAVGSTAKVGLFVAGGETWAGVSDRAVFEVLEDTPGADTEGMRYTTERGDQRAVLLHAGNRSVVLGPGTYTVKRPLLTGLIPTGHSGIGVYAES